MEFDDTAPSCMRLGARLRPIPEIANSPEYVAPPEAVRRVFVARLRALIAPYVDIPIPAFMADTPGGERAAAEKAELTGAIDRMLAEYARVGAPSILEIAAPGGWSFHVDLAAPADEIGASETGVLTASRLITVGPTVRAAAAATEARFSADWGEPAPEARFRFEPLPLPPAPPPPDYAVFLEYARRPAAVSDDELKANWHCMLAELDACGLRFNQLPRAVSRAAIDYHFRGGPPWSAVFPHTDGRQIALRHGQ